MLTYPQTSGLLLGAIMSYTGFPQIGQMPTFTENNFLQQIQKIVHDNIYTVMNPTIIKVSNLSNTLNDYLGNVEGSFNYREYYNLLARIIDLQNSFSHRLMRVTEHLDRIEEKQQSFDSAMGKYLQKLDSKSASVDYQKLDKLEALIMQIPGLKEIVESNEKNAQIEAETQALIEKEAGLNRLIDDLELSVRSHNCLKYGWEYELHQKGEPYRKMTIHDLLAYTEGSLLRFPNFGRKSLNEIKKILATMDLKLGEQPDLTRISSIEKIMEPKPVHITKHYNEVLQERAASIVKLRFMTEPIQTYKAIAIAHNISLERVRQIIAKSIRVLRRYYGICLREEHLLREDVISYLGNSEALYKEIFGT